MSQISEVRATRPPPAPTQPLASPPPTHDSSLIPRPSNVGTATLPNADPTRTLPTSDSQNRTGDTRALEAGAALIDYGAFLGHAPTDAATAAAADYASEPALNFLPASVGATEVPTAVAYKAADASKTSLWGDGFVVQQTGGATGTSAAQRTTVAAGPGDTVAQGSGADCYFLAALSSVGNANPQALKDMLRPSPDGVEGHYQVRFFHFDAQGQQQPEWIDVDNQIAVDAGGKPAYAAILPDGQQQGIIGPALVEKAWAKFNDKYGLVKPTDPKSGWQGVESDGAGPEALQALTGKPVSMLMASNDATQSFSEKGVQTADVRKVLQAVCGGAPCIAATKNPPAGSTLLPGNLHPNHMYSVSSFDAATNTVTLRNPATDFAGMPGSTTGGKFSISLDLFEQDFCEAFVSQ